jgi:DNA adenine methylase
MKTGARRNSGLSTPLKTHGGKHDLAKWIVGHMPPHLHYVEPFAGGLSVLLARDPQDRGLWMGEVAKERGVSEVVCDLNRRLTNFWRVLQRPATFDPFLRIVQATPFSEVEWTDAAERLDDPDPVERAVAFFVRCRQSLAGRMDSFTGVTRTRTRGNRNAEVNAWWNCVEGLPAVAARLRDVLILDGAALGVIEKHDGPHALFYLDPPYLAETRTAPDVYAHEMGEADHRALLDLIVRREGQVMLSGYGNPLYDDKLSGWTRHEKEINNHAAGGTEKRRMTEVLWCNF